MPSSRTASDTSPSLAEAALAARAATPQLAERTFWRWLGPLAALCIFGAVGLILHRQLAHLHVRSVVARLHGIPRSQLLTALGFTALSYWLLSTYEVLALRYLRRVIAYGRIVFTSFIAYAFGHTLGFAVFTGSAIRFRLYATAGVSAIDVATVTAFCSLSLGIGLATISGLSLLFAPAQTATMLHLRHHWGLLVGAALLVAVAAYAGWTCFGRGRLEIRGWALRPPGALIGLTQIGLAVLDVSLSSAVLWSLLPVEAHVPFVTFVGVYAVAVIAGIISHVPGGVGVFEAVILLTLPGVPADALLGSLLAYRAVYYLAPLVVGTLLFGAQELAGQRNRLAWAHELASLYIAPVVPQIAGALTFLAGALLLFSGATPGVEERLAFLDALVPLAVLEASHLAGSVVGLGLLVLARALFRRVQAAYHITVYLLLAGIVASLLKGLDFEEATLLALVLAVLVLGRRAFYRPTAIADERFTPVWVVSIVGVVAMAIWIGVLSYRHVSYSDQLWWTFALHGNAPRMLRASLAVVVLGTAYALFNLLRPARPEPSVASTAELERARPLIAHSALTLANAALSGDKRLLFSEAGDAFLMYQIAGRSWIALGDPVGAAAGAEELVWRLREMSDHHGAETVFYQVSAERLSLYVDLGLAALKIGEEARVPLAAFSLEGPARADLRQSYRRAQRDGASFEVVAPGEPVRALLPALQRISDAWLATKSTGEKRFSVGSFSPRYLEQFPVAVVRAEGELAAFANLWTTDTHEELSVDLMRFAAEAPRGAMDYLFIELMLWGRSAGYRWFNLGMAPLSGLETHPLAPAWHRVGNFIFRHGEHFYNFEGLRRYKAKFEPVWEARYLAARGGIALPRVLVDVSVLIAGGMKELFAR
ncbi:MAG: bifunctional lysylphosphatidylglycerol flippase/synthetase MprF [Gammaproteobacteria bacterium]|nr:bifunctional lysylphosphatidylglycerol flippase/synthetase MprF [Gammaproteobacteria bacterium]